MMECNNTKTTNKIVNADLKKIVFLKAPFPNKTDLKVVIFILPA